MTDESTTKLLFNQQALQLVVAQMLADQFSAAADPASAHRRFTDRIHARIDEAASADSGDFESLNASLLHEAVDLLGAVAATRGLMEQTHPNSA